jgi:cytochrome c biogenesis protein CcmG/thiol:disulfide interchange protein DsbE
MRILSLIPLVLFAFLVLAMSIKLSHQGTGEQQAFFEESALIDTPLPKFSLPSINEGYLGLNYNDFKGKYSLINVFASWCPACLSEHSILMKIKEDNILPIYGIAWKDKPENTRNWLKRNGNPYTKTASDMDGEAVISLGITGAPESFLVNKEGIIIYHHVGPLDSGSINEIISRIQ